MPSTNSKPNFLVSVYMAGGNATILQNLQSAMEARTDLDASFLPVEMTESDSRLGVQRGRSWMPGSLRNSKVTGERIAALEAKTRPFDAAYFFQHTICLFLWRFRARVPYILALDGTPLWYQREKLPYSHPDFDPKTLTSRARQLVIGRVYHKAHHLLPLCESVRDSLIHDYGVPPGKITVVPPAVDLQRFSCPDRSDRTSTDRQLRVLFVGADFVRKGGQQMLAVAARPEFQDVRFDLVSRSFQGEPTPNVHVHEGLTANSEPMVRLFQEADVFALPTHQDAHSVATIEAMAGGLPVISTPIGGIRDIVDEGKTGFLVPPGNVDALAECIRRFRDDPAMRLRMGAASRARVEERFNLSRISEQVVDLLKRAAASRR
jgi:glycosyltransferase involved in cell wall biosynthesis